MRVIFRTDASTQIGTGHVMRCLTLADALHERGAECLFICRPHIGHLLGLIAQRGHRVAALSELSENSLPPSAGIAHAQWLGTDWESDASDTKQVLGKQSVDWIVVDHYALDAQWEQQLRPICKQLMVIDDLADRQHDCDLLLDQNYGCLEKAYRDKVPAKCRLLLGPKHALLRPEYQKYRSTLRQWGGVIQRVLVFFGGSDNQNITVQSLHALMATDIPDLEIDVVVGANSQQLEQIQQIEDNNPKVRIYQNLPHLADLMVKADLALGAGGGTIWEYFCLGLPSIVISIAENQRSTCEALQKDSYLYYLGSSKVVTEQCITEKVLEVANNKHNENREQKRRIMELVTGHGAEAVCREMRRE